MTPCKRKCWDCSNIADHEDNVTPHVNCKKCGSQDTRLVKSVPPPARDWKPNEKVLVEATVTGNSVDFRHEVTIGTDIKLFVPLSSIHPMTGRDGGV